jgi:hypothetical protein
LQSLLLLDKIFDRPTFVDGSAIPEDKDFSPKVAEDVFEKTDDLQSGDIVSMQADIEPHAPVRWRDSDSGNGGDFVPLVTVPKNGGTANRTPCFDDVGNEEKTALIEEDQMGFKPSGFFLCEAMSPVSSMRWPSRPAEWPFSSASASSIGDLSKESSRRDSGDIVSQNVSRSTRPCAAASRYPLSNLQIEPLEATVFAVLSSWIRKVPRGAPEMVLTEALSILPFATPDASEQRNSMKHQPLLQRFDAVCRSEAAQQHDAFAFRALDRFLEVS